MKARVIVHLKSGVLDPQGEAVKGALGRLGYEGVEGVRIGKVVDVEIDESDEAKALEIVKKMADELLANPVIEKFDVEALP
jgi:phosphoribosylformylglycinamidine synthase